MSRLLRCVSKKRGCYHYVVTLSCGVMALSSIMYLGTLYVSFLHFSRQCALAENMPSLKACPHRQCALTENYAYTDNTRAMSCPAWKGFLWPIKLILTSLCFYFYLNVKFFMLIHTMTSHTKHFFASFLVYSKAKNSFSPKTLFSLSIVLSIMCVCESLFLCYVSPSLLSL